MKLCSYCGRENDTGRSACQECGTLIITQIERDAPSRTRFFVGCGALIVAGCIYVFILAIPRSNPKQLDGINIVGTPKFQDQVIAALVLLKTRSPEAYLIVSNYIGAIATARRSGMAAHRSPPTFDLSEQTAFFSLTWCAGAIAHDSFHSKLYHDYLRSHPDSKSVPDDVWTGEAAELKCLAHQMQVAREVDAPMIEIDWLAKTNHHYWEKQYPGNW